MRKQYNYRIGNIELRTVAKLGEEVVEIVQWSEHMCWVIVAFHQSIDTTKWNATLVEDRPFQPQVNWRHLGQLIQAGYAFLMDEEG